MRCFFVRPKAYRTVCRLPKISGSVSALGAETTSFAAAAVGAGAGKTDEGYKGRQVIGVRKMKRWNLHVKKAGLPCGCAAASFSFHPLRAFLRRPCMFRPALPHLCASPPVPKAVCPVVPLPPWSMAALSFWASAPGQRLGLPVPLRPVSCGRPCQTYQLRFFVPNPTKNLLER